MEIEIDEKELNSLLGFKIHPYQQQIIDALKQAKKVFFMPLSCKYYKTVQQIKWSAETGGLLVCPTDRQRKKILVLAEKLGLKIKEPIVPKKSQRKLYGLSGEVIVEEIIMESPK